MTYSLFDNEERIIKQAEILGNDFCQKAAAVRQSLQGLTEAYTRSLREQQRLVRVSDKQQEQLRQMTQELREKTRLFEEQAVHLQTLNDALKREIESRKQLEEELRRLATTDSLTGVYNRRRFMEIGEYEIVQMKRTQQPLTFMMLDLDRFKEVNDRYGHAAGDSVLCRFAQICLNSVRAADSVGRLGGEEFAIVLPETDSNEAYMVAQRIRRVVAANEFSSAAKAAFHLTVSIGVTEAKPEESLDQVLARADQALYAAKGSGRDRVEKG